MKRALLSLFLGLVTAVAQVQPPPDPATHYVLGLTPFLDRGAKDDVYRRVVGMILEDLPLPSSLSLFDAYYLTNITRIDLPNARAFSSGKTRANQFREPILRLRQFLAAEPARPASNIPGSRHDNALRLPQFLDFAADNLVAGRSPLTLIVIGSPLHIDPQEPGFSMVDGYFPSDGHLLASREQSIYGVRDRSDALARTVLHFGYPGNPWVSSIHQEKVARFWSLYLSRQGARLGAFSGDLATLFDAVKKPQLVRDVSLTPDPKQTKLEMLRIHRDVNTTDWITRDQLSGSRPPPPSRTVGPMKIGIRWKGDVDLDLYAAASGKAQTLFFEQTRTREGYYHKDHRSSPDRDYEFIEFEAAVDVHQVQAEVNFYKGETGDGPEGEVRIEFDGRIYSARFRIEASQGNKGRAGASQAPYWAQIDIPAVLGLRQTARN